MKAKARRSEVKVDFDMIRELSDPADEYEGRNPPFGGGRLYSANQVVAMLTGFAARMILEDRRKFNRSR